MYPDVRICFVFGFFFCSLHQALGIAKFVPYCSRDCGKVFRKFSGIVKKFYDFALKFWIANRIAHEIWYRGSVSRTGKKKEIGIVDRICKSIMEKFIFCYQIVVAE